MIYKFKDGGIAKLQNKGKIPKKQQKMFDRVTQSILDDTRDKNISTTGGFAHRTEEPLKVEHPGVALLLRKIPIGRVLTVLGNPVSANTTAGAMAATAADAAGVVASAQGLANSVNKIKSGDYTWEDVPETVLSAMGALPGASVMTRSGSWTTAVNTAKRYGEMSKFPKTFLKSNYSNIGKSMLADQSLINTYSDEPIVQSLSENNIDKTASKIRYKWMRNVIHAPNDHIDPLEYAGIPKGDRNNKFRTMKFRKTQAEKDARELYRSKRWLYDRYKAVGERRGIDFNEYGEPIVPILSTNTVDPKTVLQSKIVDVYRNSTGYYNLSDADVPFNPQEVQQGWINYFKSPAYRARVAKNSGLKTDAEIDKFIDSMIQNLKNVRHEYIKLPEIVEKDVLVYNPKTGDFSKTSILVQGTERGFYNPNHHYTVTRDARNKSSKGVFEHEDLHASLKRGTYARDVLENSGLINGKRTEPDGAIFTNGLEEIRDMPLTDNQIQFNDYVAGRDEARVRGLKILRALDEEGLPVTEENVTNKILNTENDVGQLRAFTPKSRTAYLNKLFTIPLIGAGYLGTKFTIPHKQKKE